MMENILYNWWSQKKLCDLLEPNDWYDIDKPQQFDSYPELYRGKISQVYDAPNPPFLVLD
jgi:hypothetical protein